MKNVKVLLKLALLCLFVINLEIISGLYSLFPQEIKVSKKRIAALSDFTEEKIQKAKALMEKQGYSQEQYFLDIALVMEAQSKAGVYDSGIQELAIVYNHGQINRLYQGEVIKALDKYPKIRQFVESKSVKPFEGLDLWGWLLNQYKKNFFLALVLLVLWLIESKDKKFSLRNPLSFTILLAFYPVVITYVFVAWLKATGRSIYAETEMRRTKQNLFSLLSKNELEQIRKFADSGLSIRLWRKHLSKSGLILQHSFAIALMATLMLTLVPKQCHANHNNKADLAISISAWTAESSQESMDNMGGDIFESTMILKAIVCLYKFVPILETCRLILMKTFFFLKEISRKISKVPRLAIQVNSVQIVQLTVN